MNELIKITEHDGKKAVSARELHAFLESRYQFADWIKERIDKYGFVENVDYVLLQNSLKQTGSGGHNKIEYALTVNMAKELSMVENNDKGKQARQYFIAREEQAICLLNNQLKHAEESARRRLYISNRMREIDISINGLMTERRGLVKESNKINATDFQQLSLAIFDVDYDRLPSLFPNQSKMLKIS